MSQANQQTSIDAQLFSRLSLATSGMFCIVGSLSVYVLVVFGSPIGRILAVLIFGVLLPLSVAAFIAARKDRVERSIVFIVTVWYVIAAAMMLVGARMYALLLACSIMPVLMALPFVSQRQLQRFIAMSLVLVIVGTISVQFPPLITPTVPDHIVFKINTSISALLVFVVMLAIWQSGGRLAAAAEGMREAIAALQESERSLESKVEERTDELQQALKESADLNEIAGVVNSTLDVNEVKDTIYQGLQSLFTFDQMGVFLLDRDAERLRLRLQAGLPFADELHQCLIEEGLPLDRDDSVPGACVVTNSTIFIGEIQAKALERASANSKLIYEHNPMASLLVCPLEIENKVIGCIFFSARHKAFDLTAYDIQSIERYVTQLGTAIRNAQLFQEAEESRADAERANESKGTFLANMSHEIRTPMNAIIGLTGLCLETKLTPKQEDYLVKVDGAANALRTIIDDILDFSKLEAGKFEIENIPFSLNNVLDNLATICMVRCQEKHLELVFQRDPNLPDTLIGDPTRVGQVLINLAGNAIKFTEEGQIVVEARQAWRKDNRVSIRFDVRDSGIGMNEEQLGRLFKSFSQADSSISRQYGGTGLGLAISQQLTQLMGGEIEVSSQVGVGTSFHFTLDMEVSDIEVERPDTSEQPQGLNVLVVDDNEASRDILREYLVSFGYTVTVAESGEEALEIMRPVHDFDLVLLDWMMPGMTGLDVALAIREAESPPKIVLLSSWKMPSREHRSMVDAFMPKPVKPSALLDTIMLAYGKQVVKRKRSLGLATGPEDLADIRGARVLIVDDSDINLQIACELLQKVPLVLDTASNGEDAVAMVNANSYDCVLMDIQMPGIDGYTATGLIRENFSYDELPVLAMTANVMAEDRARTLEAGMNGHVAKPVDPAELYLALLEAIPDGDYSANLHDQSTSTDESDDKGAPPKLPAAVPGLEIEQGLSRLGNNESLYLQLLGDMVRDYAEAADEIGALVAASDSDEIRGAAHKVRGIANNLGATEVGLAAEAIEQAALTGDVVSEEQIVALQSALDTIVQSHALLKEERQVDALAQPADGVDQLEVFGDLQAAVAAFDPGATELVDQLLGAQEDGGDLVARLAEVRELLDNFNFNDAEPLLASIGESLRA